MMLRALRGVSAALLLCTLAGCETEDEEVPDVDIPTDNPTPAHPSTGESWTFLVYMVADNNLEPFALDDLIEMADVGSSSKLNIVVQVDRAEGHDESGLGTLPNWTSTKRLRVLPGALETVADLGEVNMGDPRTLSEFISWGVETYPADRYALIFWDHGSAWPGFGGDESTADDDLLTLAELKSGIQSGMASASLRQFSLIGYDACLMATYEVALAMRPFGEYLLASEELEPGHGWDYRALRVLRNDPTTNPVVLSREIINGFRDQAVASSTDADITLSLTDLYALGDLEKAVEQLADAYPATSASSATATAFGRGRAAAQKFGDTPNPAQSMHMVDLGDLSDQVALQAPAVSEARAAISSALSKAVVLKVNGPERSRARGLSIYFPSSAAYYKSDYDSLPEVSAWRSFLTRFYQGGSSVVIPTFASATADVEATTSQVVFEGALSSGAAEAITSAELYYGYQEASGNLIVLGDRPAAVDTSTALASVVSSWSYQALHLTQGLKSGYAYLSITGNSGSSVSASMPFNYYAPGASSAETVIRTLIIDASGAVVQDTYYLLTAGGFGELAPEPGSVLEPLVQIHDVSTNTTYFGALSSGDALFDATQPINLSFVYLPSGTTIFGILNIENYAGQGDQAYNVLEVP